MAGKQIDFPENQKHRRDFEVAMWVISILLIIFVVAMVFIVGGPDGDWNLP